MKLRQHLIAIFYAFLIVVGSVQWVNWYYEPYPYKYLNIKIGKTVIGEDIPVEFSYLRTKLCPYISERTIYDSEGNKVFDKVEDRPTPKVLGVGKENSNIGARSLLSTPSEGVAVFNGRILSKCNLAQKWFPQKGEWITYKFEFVKKNGESNGKAN